MIEWLRNRLTRRAPDVHVKRNEIEPAAMAPSHETLRAPTTLAGIELPAGAKVGYWESISDGPPARGGVGNFPRPAPRVPCDIELPATVGVTIGELALPPRAMLSFTEAGVLSNALLAGACDLLGIPCASGTIVDWVDPSWRISKVVLARDHAIGGARYVRGTEIELDAAGNVRASSWPPVVASPDPGDTALETTPIAQGVTSRPGFVAVAWTAKPLGPVLDETTIRDRELRTLGDLRRHYPSDGTFELRVAAWGQPIAVRTRDGACFSINVEAGFLTFDDKVLEDGGPVSDTTEIERVDSRGPTNH